MRKKVQRPVSATRNRAEALAVLERVYGVQGTGRGLDEDFSTSVSTAGPGPMSPALGRYWSAGVTHLSRTLQAGDEAMSNPLLQAEMIRSLVTALLHSFPNSYLERLRAPVPEAQPGSRSVRRAVAFIETHLGGPIGITEAAARWRFAHAGRFAAAYRARYGRAPSATLHT